jgi:hypothetical protein
MLPVVPEVHMRRLCVAVLTLLALVVAPAAAQERIPHGEHGGGLSPAPETLSPRTRQLGRSLQRLREDISHTNRWMIANGAPEGLHGVGTELAHSAEHVQELVRRLDDAYADAERAGAATTLRQVDVLTSEVRALEAEMGRTLAALRRAVCYR